MNQVFNHSEFLSRVGGNKDIVQALLNSFKDTVQELIESLDTYSKSSELEEIKKIGHTLKGAASNVSAEELSEIGETLHHLNDLDNIDQLIQDTEKAWKRFCSETQTLKE